MDRLDVAIGIVTRGQRVLICQRRADNTFGDCWEFPGGKLEAGETPEACVVREVFEEVGIHVRPTTALEVIDHDYPHGSIRLRPYLCEHLTGEIEILACQDARWITPAALQGFQFPPANGPLIEHVIRRLCDPHPI